MARMNDIHFLALERAAISAVSTTQGTAEVLRELYQYVRDDAMDADQMAKIVVTLQVYAVAEALAGAQERAEREAPPEPPPCPKGQLKLYMKELIQANPDGLKIIRCDTAAAPKKKPATRRSDE